MLVFDSGHYLETANLLVSGLVHGLATDGQKQCLGAALMLDGPVLPGLAALFFITFGKWFSLWDWQCLLGLQAFLHGLSAALVFFIARQIFTPGRNWALAAGLIWAINPVAVLSSQRFLSEDLAADLLLLFFLLGLRLARAVAANTSNLSDTANSSNSSNTSNSLGLWADLNNPAIYVQGLALGLTCGLILFTKTALIPCTFLIALAVAVKVMRGGGSEEKKSPLPVTVAASALAIALGFICTIAPWAAFTKYAIGETHYFPQRAPTLNLMVGWNFDTDGLSTLPLAPLSEQLQEESKTKASAPLAVAALFRRAPGECFSLTFQKMARLYGLPWNDFRRSSLGFSPRMQMVLHQVCLLLALLCLCLAVAAGAPFVVWLLVLAVAGHFVFLLFESVPRYSYSSYPLIFLMALHAVRTIALMKWQRRHLGCAVALLITILIAFNIDLPLSWLALRFSQEGFFSLGLLVVLIALILPLMVRSLSLPLEFDSGQRTRLICALGAVALFYSLVQMFYVISAPERGEWQVKLGPGQEADRCFSLPQSCVVPTCSLIVIDGLRQIGQCQILVNGKLLQSPAVNLYEFMADRKEHFQFAEQVAALMGRSAGDIRRWWAVPVPASMLALDKQNTVALKVPAGAEARLWRGWRQGGTLSPTRLSLCQPGPDLDQQQFI